VNAQAEDGHDRRRLTQGTFEPAEHAPAGSKAVRT